MAHRKARYQRTRKCCKHCTKYGAKVNQVTDMEGSLSTSIGSAIMLGKEVEQTAVSPYTTPAITVAIGPRHIHYAVPQEFLNRCSRWADRYIKSRRSRTIVYLPEIDEDIGNTVIHYLYTGAYETLKSHHISDEEEHLLEFKRCIKVYCVARVNEMDNLATQARRHIRKFGLEIPTLQVLSVIEMVYAQLPDDEAWLPKYVIETVNRGLNRVHIQHAERLFKDRIEVLSRYDESLLPKVKALYNKRVTRGTHDEHSYESAEYDSAPWNSSQASTATLTTSPVQELVSVAESATTTETPHNEEIARDNGMAPQLHLPDLTTAQPVHEPGSVEELGIAESEPAYEPQPDPLIGAGAVRGLSGQHHPEPEIVTDDTNSSLTGASHLIQTDRRHGFKSIVRVSYQESYQVMQSSSFDIEEEYEIVSLDSTLQSAT